MRVKTIEYSEIEETVGTVGRGQSLEHIEEEGRVGDHSNTGIHESIGNHSNTGIHESTGNIESPQEVIGNLWNIESQGTFAKYGSWKEEERTLLRDITCKKIVNQIIDSNTRRITRNLIANHNISVVPIVSRRIIERITQYIRMYFAGTEQGAVSGVVHKLVEKANDGKEE